MSSKEVRSQKQGHGTGSTQATDGQNFAMGKILQILTWIFDARHAKNINGQKVHSF
jgi:hypothetical protein